MTIGVQESGKEEQRCPATTAVSCTGPLTPSYMQQSSNGTVGTGATVPVGGTMTYIITNLSPNTFYSVADAGNGNPYASGVWTGGTVNAGSSLTITTYPLVATGTYNGVVKATSLSATSMCSSLALASAFSVLPVTIVEFKGAHNNKMNLLTWKTASEEKTDRFEIEKSGDGSTFLSIGAVRAKGVNSTYTFTDGQATASSYYRLRIVDADGTITFSRTILLKENGTSIQLKAVRPNPFVNEITVSVTVPTSQAVTVSLLDATGKLVSRKQVRVQGTSDVKVSGLTGLAKGLYILKVNAGGSEFQEKLIKQD
ncbi:T9SS type A sorting domain-containing protein [Flavisolibacter sp. BT320]|nr:T9SS type A sorting domain-containing protein [Flavisolibacter longurius]